MVVLACLFAILPSRLFYRALTVLGFVAVITVVLVFIVTPFLSHDTFVSNVTEVTGQTPAEIIAAGAYPEGGFSFLGFMAMCSFGLFVFFGFQFASFVSGEMSGSVKRTALYASLGTLVLAGFISTIYNDVLARKFGVELTASWSYLFWTGGDAPGGITGSPSTLGAIANPDLWPIWALLGLVAALFTWLLMPVYLVVASRIIIAWSLDRQAPEWIGRVNARTNAPVNAIILGGLAAEVILYLTVVPRPQARCHALVHHADVLAGSHTAGHQCNLRPEAATRPLRRDFQEAAFAGDRLARRDQYRLRDGDLQADLRRVQRRHRVPELLRCPGLRSSPWGGRDPVLRQRRVESLERC